MELPDQINDVVEAHGFLIVERVLEPENIQDLIAFVESQVVTSAGRGGVRNLLDLGPIKRLAASVAIREMVEPILGPDAKVVRGILFDKTSDSNWKVPWHQDVTIAVSRKVDADGFGVWSMKSGVLHVQPPADILEKMISLRIHLDDCPETNGALRVIAGSHRLGKLPASLPEDYFASQPATVCEVKSGGALLMRPLLLHASSASVVPGHRRVVHFDYSAANLPEGMGWAVDQA